MLGIVKEGGRSIYPDGSVARDLGRSLEVYIKTTVDHHANDRGAHQAHARRPRGHKPTIIQSLGRRVAERLVRIEAGNKGTKRLVDHTLSEVLHGVKTAMEHPPGEVENLARSESSSGVGVHGDLGLCCTAGHCVSCSDRWPSCLLRFLVRF